MKNIMMNKVGKGVLTVVGGVIGLVIISEIIGEETGTDGAFDELGLTETIVGYITPLLALGLLAGTVGIWRFS